MSKGLNSAEVCERLRQGQVLRGPFAARAKFPDGAWVGQRVLLDLIARRLIEEETFPWNRLNNPSLTRSRSC